MLLCPERGKASFPSGSKGQAGSAWSSDFIARGFWSPEVTQVIDINMNPSCCRTTDPDMALSSTLALDNILIDPDMVHGQVCMSPLPQVTVLVTQRGTAPATAWSSHTFILHTHTYLGTSSHDLLALPKSILGHHLFCYSQL